MSVELTSEIRQKIIDEIKAGRKISAIKLYREYTDCSLVDAKDFIEALTSQLKEQDPEAFQKAGVGCGTSVLFCIMTFGFLLIIQSLC